MRGNPSKTYMAWGLIILGVALVAVSTPWLWNRASEQEGMPLEDFPTWVSNSFNTLSWETEANEYKLNRMLLKQSLQLGQQFLVNNQNSEGNFNYEYDFVIRETSEGDSQVRQAGALWGLALIYKYNQNPATGKALNKGLNYFFKHTQQGPVKGSLLIAYPDEKECRTGTVALVALAIIEYLHTAETGSIQIDTQHREKLSHQLKGYLKFLEHLYLGNGRFSESFSLKSRLRGPRSNPYFDGETLLCLIKAARYLGYTELIPLIEDSAVLMAKRYTIDAWQEDVDSPLTKGFYQWGSMAFWEYQDARWRHGDMLGDCTLLMAWWMINTHHTLARKRNTAYAYEGIIYAYRLAKTRNLQIVTTALAGTIDTGLYKLTSWQVGGPLEHLNPFLLDHPTDDLLAVGGIMNHKAEAPLRIDVTQHQMHAVVLALKDVYTDSPTH